MFRCLGDMGERCIWCVLDVQETLESDVPGVFRCLETLERCTESVILMFGRHRKDTESMF